MKTGEYSDPTRIRAHHLLCMQGFQGYGYSKEFERHMEMLINYLNSNPSSKIQLTTKTDEICSHCPYNIEDICKRDSDSLNIMENLDKLVIEKTLLKEDEIYTIGNILELVNTNLDYNTILEICGNCSWNDMCLFFKNKI